MNKILLLALITSINAFASGSSGSTLVSDFDRTGGYFGLNVARGLVPGISYDNKFGRNPAVTAAEDVWATGGTWAAPATASTVNVASASADDTAAGSGARTVRISGLNENYLEVMETLTLNGTNNVLSVNSYWIIHRAIVLTAGSGATNAGAITLTSTAAGTPVLSTILATMAQTQFGIFQVPAGKTAYIDVIQACFQNTTNDTITDVNLFVKPFGGVFSLKVEINLMKTGTSCYTKTFTSPLKYEEKSIMKFRATPSAGTSVVTVDWDIFLVNN